MAKAEFCHGVSNAVKGDREERRNGVHNSQFGVTFMDERKACPAYSVKRIREARFQELQHRL